MTLPGARLVGEGARAAREQLPPRPHRRMRFVVLAMLVPMLVIPLVVFVVQVAGDTQRMMAKSPEPRPDPIDLSVVARGATLAKHLRAELGTTDAAVAAFVRAVADDQRAAIALGDEPCAFHDDVVLMMPLYPNDMTSYGVRVSAPGAQVDPGTIAGLAVDADHAIAGFAASPTASSLRTLEKIATKLDAIVFVVATTTPATIQALPRNEPGRFEPGALRGTGYVYSAREPRLRCSGAISITNARELDWSYHPELESERERRASAEQALAYDLESQLLRALETRLHVVK